MNWRRRDIVAGAAVVLVGMACGARAVLGFEIDAKPREGDGRVRPVGAIAEQASGSTQRLVGSAYGSATGADVPGAVMRAAAGPDLVSSAREAVATQSAARVVPDIVMALLESTGQVEADYFAYQDALRQLATVRSTSAGCRLFSDLETEVRGRIEHFFVGRIAPRILDGSDAETSTRAAVGCLDRFRVRASELLQSQPRPSAHAGYGERARILEAWRGHFVQIAAELDVLERATEAELQRVLGKPRAPFISYLGAL